MTFEEEDFLWNGEPLRGLCGHCQIQVDSTDPNHRVTSILRGGRGVECVLRGDIEAKDAGPLRLPLVTVVHSPEETARMVGGEGL